MIGRFVVVDAIVFSGILGSKVICFDDNLAIVFIDRRGTYEAALRLDSTHLL